MKGGVILFGISDEKAKIEGVLLNHKEQDQLQIYINELY